MEAARREVTTLQIDGCTVTVRLASDVIVECMKRSNGGERLSRSREPKSMSHQVVLSIPE